MEDTRMTAYFDYSGIKDEKVAPFELPADGLPTDLFNCVADVQLAYQTNRDFAITSLYSASATLLGKRVSWKWRNYTNHATLWIANVAPSSVGKSAPQSFFFDGIQKIDTQSYNDYKSALKQWETDKGDKPTFHCHLMNNATDEAALMALAYNDAICWNADELDSVFSGWGQYKKNGNNIVANLLSIFNYQPFTSMRVHSEPIRVDNPALSIFGGIQPDTLKRVMGSKGYETNGLLQRFLYSYPDITDIPHLPEEIISLDEAKASWQKHIDMLLRSDGELYSSPLVDDMLRDKHNEWIDKCNTDKYKGFDSMVALIRKMTIHCCRWAIITALLNGSHEITEDVMQYSIRCMDYFIRCGEKVFCLIHNDKRLTNKEVIRMLGERYPKLNRSKLAEALGISQSMVSGSMPKAPADNKKNF